MNISSPLSADATKVAGEALQATLVDLIDLSLLGKQAHWNVVGPLFKTVHEHLDEVVDTARQYSDEVAERAVALGVNPDGTAGTVANESPLSPLGATWVPTGDAVAAMVAALDTITSRLRERIAVLDEVDLVSQDLIIEVTDAIEAHRWMFAAQLA
ncbi:MAG: DNA starvation/stationary phase protection protein [Jiangellales bacterium]